MSLEGGGHSISLGLPTGTTPGRAGSTASLVDGGTYAEYTDFLPGGIDLRVSPEADGFTSFLVLPERPATNEFIFAITSDLTLTPDKDDSFTFRDADGNVHGQLRRPFLVDSSEVEGRGGGLYSEAVTMSVRSDGDQQLLTLTVDPKTLDDAVYPVYLDPTTTKFPDQCGSCSAGDTFASSKYPGSNFNNYKRPDDPGYYEMWHGNEPGTSYYNEVYIRFNGLEDAIGAEHIDSAILKFYPYWQYSHYTPRSSWIKRVTSSWTAASLTWNARPTVEDDDWMTFQTTEGSWSDPDVKAYVQDVVNGTWPDEGLMIHANSLGQVGWKRIVSRKNSTLRPKLVITYTPFAAPSIFYPNSATGETSTRTLQWTLPAESVQNAFQVQVDDDSGFGSPVYDSGGASLANTYDMIPNSTTLIDGQLYYWRVRVKYGNNTAFSDWSANAESNVGTPSPAELNYCYDALNRLQYRNTDAACTSSSDEEYVYDDAGNRIQADEDGTLTYFDYNGDGQLTCVYTTSCAADNVDYDSAGRTASYAGWVYEYDAEGRLVTACESSSCAGSIDKVEFAYDGDGHRTQIKEYLAGVLDATVDFRYRGDAIVEELTDGTVSRSYVVDDAGTVIKFCDPDCSGTNPAYLVMWNGHGDALAVWLIDSVAGTLTLANSYTYSSWGAPTTATHNSIADLGFRFLYVGAADVQWDDFSGLGLYYMHARHYSPALGRFLQPDPAALEANHYSYSAGNPVTSIDPMGLMTAVNIELYGGGKLVYIPVSTPGKDLVAAMAVGASAVICLILGCSVSYSKPDSPGSMEQEVRRGQAPRSVKRVDPRHVAGRPGEQPHVHFRDGTARNQDGSMRHGDHRLTNEEKRWLQRHGWKV